MCHLMSRTKMRPWAAALLFSSVVPSFILPKPTQNCSTFAESLVHSFPSQNVTISNATLVPANASNNVYDYCHMVGNVAYTSNDTLNFQVYLPEATAYNGRFMAVGNGGMAGTIDTANMLNQLNKGFAVAGGDAGHLASKNHNGSGAPDTYIPYLHDKTEIKAWIHNAISIFTPAAKTIVAQYYGTSPRKSYYDGCSTGGAQGFALAQFHPELFDGIYAGSPGNWYSHLVLSFLWNTVPTQGDGFLSQSTLGFITEKVLEACDELDGVKDNVLENPLKCRFDVDSLACDSTSSTVANSSSTCLSGPQLAAAKAIYSGPTSALDGSELYPGFSFGSEVSWLLQEGDLANAFSVPILQNAVFDNLTYDAVADFNWGSDVQLVDEKVGVLIDEISVDLSAFRARGGKLIVTQGWADPYCAALWPIQHLQDVESFFGGDVSDFFNLFMVPGGGHCGSAPNYPNLPSTYHTVEALVDWVERGEKPQSVLSTGAVNGTLTSRKLCPWPQTATYIGGDIGFAGSYGCEIS